MDDSTASPSTPRQYANFRSAASMNWRVKDDSPRVEQQQPRSRTNTPRQQNNGGGGRGGGGGGGSPYTAGAGAAEDTTPGTRLYVGNLLYTAQRADIESLFSEHGFTVAGVSISTDPFTGRNPSYCFVDLDSAEEAQRAIAELNGVDVLGRVLRVSPGVAKRGSAQGGQNDSGAAASGGVSREARTKNYDRGHVRDVREERSGDYKPTFDRWSRTDASSHWQAPQNEGRRLYVGGLPRIEPQSALDEEIQALFSTTDVTPAAVSKLISPHPSKVSEPGNHYYCFVDVPRVEDVDLVIDQLAGKEGSWGGPLRVSRARGGERKVTREQGSTSNGGERRSAGQSTWRRRDDQQQQQQPQTQVAEE